MIISITICQEQVDFPLNLCHLILKLMIGILPQAELMRNYPIIQYLLVSILS
jgi:hypothetical protein